MRLVATRRKWCCDVERRKGLIDDQDMTNQAQERCHVPTPRYFIVHRGLPHAVLF
jgi:hypothetical protein